MKTVRFSTDDLETIVPTYSHVDYDRGSLSIHHSQKLSSSSTTMATPPMIATTATTTTPMQHHPQQRTNKKRPQPTNKRNPFMMKPSSTTKRPFITPLDLSGVPNACRRSPAPIGHQVLAVSKVSSLMIH